MSKQPAQSPVHLTNASQWHTWIAIVRSSAKQSNIWHLIDPSLDQEPSHDAPTLPKRSNIRGNDDIEKNNNYTDAIQQFNFDYKEYRERREALVRTLSAIQNTVSAEYLTYILDKDTPWKALRTLRKAIEPHSAARNLEINNQYKTLCAGPPRGQNLRQWMNKWEKIYVEAKEIKHADVESGFIIDYFIKSLKGTDPSWAATSEYDIDMKRSNGEKVPSFMDMLNNFRRKHTTDQYSTNSSSFAATLQGRTPEPASPNSHSPSPMPTPKCICGRTHWYKDCYYLMEHKRPKTWKPNAEIMKKVDEALKDPTFKSRVEKAKQRDQRFQTSSTSAATTSATTTTSPTPELPSEPQVPRSFATTWHRPTTTDAFIPSSYSVDKGINHDILNCWILDSGSNIHVCNDPDRFKTTHTTTPDDYLVSGSTTYQIEAYGTVDITVDTPTGRRESITLQHVALIPGFFTNLISFSRAKDANIYWDTAKDTLYTVVSGKQNHFCTLRPHNGHWIVEYNDPHPPSSVHASSAAAQDSMLPQNHKKELGPSPSPTACRKEQTPTASGATNLSKTIKLTPTQLHQIMAHAGAEAISKLPSAANGIKLTHQCAPNEFRSCEACRLSKAHAIISRSSDHEIPSTKPCYRICYDLIPMAPAYNSDQWISHFICDYSGFHWVYTHRSKYEAIKYVQRMVDLAKNHHHMPISFIRLDGEPALGHAFDDLCNTNGIVIERTPPYTPSQNGKSERAGREITTKSRCIGISANLPHDLWPETVAAAAYILNRTPSFKTDITPFEALYGIKPTLSHMHIYGCRAYPLKHNIPKLQKLEPRAHIGYLVGYDSRNIFRIWIPSKNQVIRTRDVSFDENTFYKLDDVDGALLVQEEELQHTIQILQEIPEEVLAHNQDLEELEIPALTHTNPTPPTNTEQPDKSITTERQPYPSPALSDVHNTQSSISAPPSVGAPAVNNEGNGENVGERPWEYRPVGASAPRSIEISANMDENLILPTRTRNRRQAHAAIINHLNQYAGYHAAFAINPVPKDHLHRDRLPEEPKSWKQMLKTPACESVYSGSLSRVRTSTIQGNLQAC